MNRGASYALAALTLLVAVSPEPCACQVPVSRSVPAADPVSLEWSTRQWALDPARSRASLELALGAADWTRRAAALDALARAAASGAPLLEDVAAIVATGLGDPHPNVRARAVALLALAPALELPGAALPEQLAADSLPAVRLELARALGVRADRLEPASVRQLAALARDGDGRVATAARAGLWALADPGPAAQFLAECFAEGTTAERVALAELIVRTRGLTPPGFGAGRDADATWTAALRTALEGASDERRALLEAALFLAGADGDGALLARGWDAPDASGSRAAFLARSAWAAGPELARALLARLADGAGSRPDLEPDQPGADDPAAGDRAADDPAAGDRERAWIVAAADAAGAAVLNEPLTRELSVEHATLLLGSLVSWTDALDPDTLAFWLEPARALAEREAAVRLLTILVGARDGRGRRAGEQLTRLLKDADAGLAEDAWSALAVADDPRPYLADLHAAWLARGAPPADLARFSRAIPLTPFREDLLELGQRGGEERGAVLDLLEAFTHDAEVAEALARWLAEELATFGFQPAERDERTSWRPAELRAMGALRALAHVGRAEDLDVVEGALEWSRGRSTQVGKVAAASLARLPGGLERLPAHLGDELDRRTRIEVAIALARSGSGKHAARAEPAAVEAATAALERDLPYAAWDLRVRMIGALAGAATRSSRAVLERELFDPNTEPGERPAVINALVDAGGGAALTPLFARVVRDTQELAPRRAAVRGLGRIGAAALLAELELEFADETGLQGVMGEAAQLLLGEARQARAALGEFTPEERHSLLAPALASAAADLSARFHGDSTAGVEFRWRTELEIATALAARGQLAEALKGQPWWRIDGALLRALGECALVTEPETARRLLRAAHVALMGEPEADGRRVAQLLARERDLAGSAGDTPAQARAAAALAWMRREEPGGR